MLRITVTRGPERWFSKKDHTTVHEFTSDAQALKFLQDLHDDQVKGPTFDMPPEEIRMYYVRRPGNRYASIWDDPIAHYNDRTKRLNVRTTSLETKKKHSEALPVLIAWEARRVEFTPGYLKITITYE